MKKRLRFSKMHGLGNDFILIDGINQRIDDKDLSSLARTMCDRNFGIGADGLIIALKSDSTDIKMRVINSDGSEPEMCGNGIRCFSKFVYEKKLIEKVVFSVETLAGNMVQALIIKDGVVVSVEVDMGEPILIAKDIPVVSDTDQAVCKPIDILGKTYEFTAVSMGNPHAVVFLDDLKTIDLEKIGPLFESHSNFPEKINTEFVQIVNPNESILIVWERGAGETLACGTGACASVVAGVLNKKCERKVKVHLPGGPLMIEWQEHDNHLVMTGPAELVFDGQIEI
ncbi:diaminopimelate epimerase [bacterium]|jgi:diaminopimelate epimerase|nr:diaminopimelate epimerase [bacterium]